MLPTNKNIAVLHPYVHKMGGAVKMMIYLSNFLHKKNNLTFYTFSYNENIFLNEKINFNIKSYYKTSFLRYISFIIIAYKIRKSDYIIIGNSPMHFVGVISKILFFSKAKIIWWNHHYPWYYSGNTNISIKLKQFIEKLIVFKIDLVISNCQYIKNSIDKIWNINSKILYPILDDEFLNYKLDKYTYNKNNIIFTYGRRSEGKNLQLVFKTYEKLKSQISDLTLLIGGEGNELEYFKLKYKNTKNIKFLGCLVKKQIIHNLINSKIFLFPSTIDSFGLVKLESLSIGVPVICFDNYYEEIIQNGFNGFCVKTENDFIQSSKEILTNSSLQKKLSNNTIISIGQFTKLNFQKQLSDIFMF